MLQEAAGMEARRYESAPAWLLALAAIALGLTALAAREASRAVVIQATGPKLAGATPAEPPLEWPGASLRPLPPAALPADPAGGVLGRSAAFLELRATPPLGGAPAAGASRPDPLWRLSAEDLMAASPRVETPAGWARSASEVFAETRRELFGLVVLFPERPRWSALIASHAAARPMTRARACAGQAAAPAPTLPPGAAAALRRAGGELAAYPGWLLVGRAASAAPGALQGARDAVATLPGGERWLAKWIEPASPLQRGPRLGTPRLPTIPEYVAAGRPGALPVAASLAEQLDRVADHPAAAGWAWAVAYQVRKAAESRSDEVESTRATLARLAEEAHEAARMAESSGAAMVATELRRAGYAIERRGAAWGADLDRRVAALARRREAMELAQRVAALRWAMSSNGWGIAPQGLAGRPESEPAPAQGDAPRFAQTPSALMAAVERYESTPAQPLARRIMAEAIVLRESGAQDGAAMAEAIDRNYRNANLRVAIAAELIDRFLPETQPQRGVVRDRIAGSPVRGWSTTTTDLAVRLNPSDTAWSFGLEARGAVRSDTYSRGGPAVVRSRGEATFIGRKPVVVDQRGIELGHSAVESRNRATLAGVRSSYDWAPLVGPYVRRIARDRFVDSSGVARSEVRRKVEAQVAERLDAEAKSAAERIREQWRAEVLDRADTLGLAVTPIEMRTTDKRLIARLRLAGPEQLGAHTPRMRAPSDSVLSVQMHESSLNNAVEGLGLAGKRMTTSEVRALLADRLRGRPSANPSEDEAVLHFAAEEPVRLSFDGGRAELTIALREMVVRGVSHRNFKVHAFFRPIVDATGPAMVQDGTPQIEGAMRSSSRLRLHGVWGKVLTPNRRFDAPLADPAIAPKLDGLEVNQFVIEDGWLGLAITPDRRSSVAARVGRYVR